MVASDTDTKKPKIKSSTGIMTDPMTEKAVS